MPLPTAFTNNTSPTGEELDADLAALGALTPIPCAIAGTNTVTLAPATNTPTVSAYANYGLFTGIAAATNTGPVTAQFGGLAALNVYKDTLLGPVLLTGGEIVINTKIMLMYDSTLNTGAGGFHLVAPPAVTTRIKTTTASIAINAISPQQGSTATVSLPGTSVGDVIGIGFPTAPSIGINWQGFVPNVGTVVLQAFNMATLTTITPTAGVYRITAQGYS